MAQHSYCNSCGAHNAQGVKNCQTCGCECAKPVRKNPINSAAFANPKLALFDIDRTILDTTERNRSAVRAGVQPKDFNHQVFTQMNKKDTKKREDFMYREDMLAKDTVMPNSIKLIEHLMQEGYTIAYCTGRHYRNYEKTKTQLEEKGFPLFQDNLGETLLFLRKSSSESKAPYKAKVMQKLSASYQIDFVFDDTVEVLQRAAQLGIPGAYPSIGLYWSMISPRSNPSREYLNEYPYIMDEKGGRKEDGDAPPYQPGSDTMGRTYLDQDPTMMPQSKKPKGVQKSLGDFKNPPNSTKAIIKLKNKTQSDKVNKLRKELTKKGIEFDSDITGGKYPKVRTWFLDFSLRGATAKQVIAQLKKAKIPHKVEQVKSNPSNPAKVEKGKKLYKHMNGKLPAKVEKKTIDIGDVWYQVGEGGCWEIGYKSGKETGSSDQKYIHHFNEETKDGNLPKLYATMPENGKPMLIITGGTWKIKTDENGVAWIYD